jgi:hypothetical protein
VKFAFLTNIEGITLAEGTNSSWVHAMSIGTKKHPVFGDISFTPERIKRFADNVNNRVRGVDPDIDYDHKAKIDEAAGWVKQAEARSDGLWLFVEWTKTAVDKIKEKAYKYFSPTFTDEWEDAAGVKHTDVVFGGALTNRPFLKDLVPVNLSELVGDPPVVPNQPKEGEGMDPKLLRQMLKLAEDATDEQVQAALKKLTEAPPAPPAPNDPKVLRQTLGLAETATDEEVAAKLKSLTETPSTPVEGITVEQALAELSAATNNPGLKALTDLITAQHQELSALNKKSKEQTVETKLKELDEGKPFKVPPVVKNHLRHIMLNSPDAVANAVFDQYKQTIDLGLIDMTEKGWVRKNADQTPEKQFEAAVKKLMEADKALNYADAVQQASAENPKLYDEYREQAFSFREQ